METSMASNKAGQWRFGVFFSRKTIPAFIIISGFFMAVSLVVWVISLSILKDTVSSDSYERFKWGLLVVSLIGVFGGMGIMFGASLQIAMKISKGLLRVANGDLTVRLFPVWCPVNSNVAKATDFLSQKVGQQIMMLNDLLGKQVTLSIQLLDLTDRLSDQMKNDRTITEIGGILSEITAIAAKIEKTARYFKVR